VTRRHLQSILQIKQLLSVTCPVGACDINIFTAAINSKLYKLELFSLLAHLSCFQVHLAQYQIKYIKGSSEKAYKKYIRHLKEILVIDCQFLPPVGRPRLSYINLFLGIENTKKLKMFASLQP